MFNNREKFFNIIHVGGRGRSIGPASELLEKCGNDIELVIFEADPSLVDAGLPQFSHKARIISKCLSNCTKKSDFYINSDARSSSLFKVSDSAEEYITPTRWGDNCRTVDTIKVDVTTIDELYSSGQINLPNFISLDAQGAEYDILEGASIALSNSLVGVITEVEFREIYAGQKLFSDQDNLLRKYDFDLHHFFNWQFWHYNSLHTSSEEGFPLTAEALYLRNFKYFVDHKVSLNDVFTNITRLLIVSNYFKKYSYVDVIMKYIKDNCLDEWNNFLVNTDYSHFIFR